MSWVEAKGRLVYDPPRPDMRKLSRKSPWLLVAELPGYAPEDFSAYYRWHLRQRGIGFLQQPAWKPHITILDGRKEVKEEFRSFWKKYDGLVVPLEYGIELEKVWKFWVLPVRCPFFNEVREELGFKYDYPFHITIGREYELPEKG